MNAARARRHAIWPATFSFLAAGLWPFGAVAQSITPPQLTHYEPAGAVGSGARPAGRVVLALELDEGGRVLAAAVMEGLDPERNAKALAAAERLVFEPATRDGRPVRAKLRFAYDFPAEGPAPAITPASAPPLTPAPPLNPASTHAFAPPPALPPAAPALTPAPAFSSGSASPPSSATSHSAEILVRGASPADRARRSAHAVDVIELEQAQGKSGDLGELMARSRGVTVQRAGGLGSDARFSLNGLEGDQIRFFLDGVPLDYAGFSFGFANVPVNLVERVEVYRGVVPARFGADALGGAVDLLTDDHWRPSAAYSYQAGAFDTHRVTGQATARWKPGLFLRTNAFYDTTRNDYLVDVAVADRFGQESPVRVRRFHDAYRAQGLALEGGLRDERRGRLLSLRAYYTASTKEVQHGATMVVPYGGVEQATHGAGAYLRYRERLLPRLHVSAVGGYGYGKSEFVDLATCVYNWFGQCTLERSSPGEIEAGGRDVLAASHVGSLRATAELRIGRLHRARISTAPEAVWRSIDERRLGTYSGLSATEGTQRLRTAVSGVEYQLDLFEDRLQNVLFGKSYVQAARFERRLPSGRSEELARSTREWGAGDAARLRVIPELWLKASYEYATRLPRADEVFGDGALTQPNLELRPELSHNLNLGAMTELASDATGALRAEINGFFRDTTDLIRRTGTALYFSHQNVARARTLGVEASARLASPREYAALDLAATLQDSRNQARSGPYAAQRGDRIPNRPYAFGAATLTARVPGLFDPSDALSLSFTSRYVHEFFRTWESLGARELKPTIPTQLLHTVSAVYEVRSDTRSVTTSFELQNLSDERSYDFFGVQRPGRAAFFKATLEI